MDYTTQNHPARRRRKGDRPTEPLTFDEPAARLVFEDEPAPTTQAEHAHHHGSHHDHHRD